MPNFESGQHLIDVTSMHRPDIGWTFVDAQGHEHRWYVFDKAIDATLNDGIKGQLAKFYDPSARYGVPSVVWVKTGEEYYWPDDDEPHDVGHHACRECGEQVELRYTSDTVTQYIGGMRWYKVDGQPVSKDEFDRRIALESQCEACEAGYRLAADGIHYDDSRGGWTWGVCRKRTKQC